MTSSYITVRERSDMNYKEVNEWLGKRDSRQYSRICRVFRVEDDTLDVQLHSTVIARMQSTGAVELNTGGWRTPITKRYMNDFISPWNLYQEQSVWYLVFHGEIKSPHPYVDHVRVYSSGKIVYPTAYIPNVAKQQRRSREIARYAREFARKVVSGEIPAPGPGDCFDCYLVTEKGISLGDVTETVDHLLSHIGERYYVPSLLANAIAEYPIGPMFQAAITAAWSGNHGMAWVFERTGDLAAKQIASSIRRYLHRRLDGKEV